MPSVICDSSVPGLRELDQHLDAVLSPSASASAGTNAGPPELNPSLFDDVTLRVTEDNAGAVAAVLLPRLVALLDGAAIRGGQGPLVNTDAVCSLAVRLLSQPGLSFSDVLAIAPVDSLVKALGRDATPATNKLAIAVLDKAVAGPRTSAAWRPSPSEAHNLAELVREGLFQALVVCWLTSPDTGVGDYAERVLVKLLDADHRPLDARRTNGTNGTNGAGQLWEALLEDHTIYVQIILAACGTGLADMLLRGPGEWNEAPDADGAVRTAPHRAIAQARVLSILPALACLDFRRVAKSAAAGSTAPALLEFAWRQMVDERDPLMLRNLHSFYVAIVGRTRCFLADSDARTGTSRGSRRRLDGLDDIADPELHYQVGTLRDLVHMVAAANPALAAQLRALPNEAAVAAERGLTTREDAEDMRTWVRLLVPEQSTLAVR